MAEFKLRHAHQPDPNTLSNKAFFEAGNVDFIPFACYYNENTIITKNGELMKVIRITGFNHEDITSGSVNLRDTIRQSISKHIRSDEFALWITTIRRKKNISPKGHFPDFFSQKLNDIWEKENNWNDQFINELYITIIIEGFDTSISNINSLIRSFSIKSTKKLHSQKLQESYKKLNNVTSGLVKDLDVYGAKIIGVKEFGGDFYSEPMRFFGKIVNLNEDRFPLTATDMSEELVANYRIAFGNNSLSVTGNNTKHYAAMFSIKEYQEILIRSLDKFLQIPQEFIITQSVDFIDKRKALLELDYQNYVLDVSRDHYTRELSGLENVISSDLGTTTDFGEQQITIMLINKSTAGLAVDIEVALSKLHDLGLVTIREDIFSELCFWSQLPGNFRFLRRQKAINISRIAGFASLHNFPAGNREGNYWGNAVTVFRTIFGTPYFFNFHDGKNGNTMIVGPKDSGKTVLLNFLIGQARKFKSKIYYFCHNHSSKIFINAIEGIYLSITRGLNHSETLKMCPLSLNNNEENRLFLQNWFKSLVNYGSEKAPESEIELIGKIVDKIIAADVKKLSAAAEFFNHNATKNIYKKLAPWHSQGKYAFLFDNEVESNLDTHLVNAFDLSAVIDKKAALIPIFSYLLHKIETKLDGTPTILVLDEAWVLLDNYVTGPKINEILKRFKEKNCIIVFATESAKDAAKSNITGSIYENVATHIFLPDPNPSEYYKTVFGLSEDEFDLLLAMNSDNRHFLLKHTEDSIIGALDLSKAQNVTAILSANKNTLYAMDELKKRHGQEADKWVPYFLDLIDDIFKDIETNKDGFGSDESKEEFIDGEQYQNDIAEVEVETDEADEEDEIGASVEEEAKWVVEAKAKAEETARLSAVEVSKEEIKVTEIMLEAKIEEVLETKAEEKIESKEIDQKTKPLEELKDIEDKPQETNLPKEAKEKWKWFQKLIPKKK